MSTIDPIILRKRSRYGGFRYQREEIAAKQVEFSGEEWREIIAKEDLRLERVKEDPCCFHAIGKRKDGRPAEIRYEIYQEGKAPAQIDLMKEEP